MFISPPSYQEERFLKYWNYTRTGYTLERQYQIGPYYADFVHLDSLTVIEIDGAAYHSSPEQIERDRRRQRFIESQGFKVIRFSGKTIHHTPGLAVKQVAEAIEDRLYNEIWLLP